METTHSNTIFYFMRAAGLSLRLSAAFRLRSMTAADDTPFYPCPVGDMGFRQDGLVLERFGGWGKNKFHQSMGSPNGAFHFSPDNLGLPMGYPYGTICHSINFIVNTKQYSVRSYTLATNKTYPNPLPHRGYPLVTDTDALESLLRRSYTLVTNHLSLKKMPHRGYPLVTDTDALESLLRRSYTLVTNNIYRNLLPQRGYPLVTNPHTTYTHSINHFADA